MSLLHRPQRIGPLDRGREIQCQACSRVRREVFGGKRAIRVCMQLARLETLAIAEAECDILVAYLVHSIASPLTTELREDRSGRSASRIERWCPRAREQAALPPGCSHCKTLQVAACGTTLQDKSDKRFSGVIATLPRSVAPRRQFTQECGIPWTPRLACLHMARIVRRPCRVDAF